MCSLLCDTFWRLGGLGSKEKCDAFFLITKALVVYDIVSDFLFWTAIRDDDDVPTWTRTAVLVFACTGVLVDAIGSCRVCRHSVPDAWGKDQAQASNNYKIGQKKLALALLMAEDVPQLCLSTWITVACKHELTNWYIMTATGTALNILRVLILSTGYILYERRARRIMTKRNRDHVRVTCCGCTVQSYRWEPTTYFGEMGRPGGGSEDIRLCGCC